MLNQLQFKLQVEEQYKLGIEKMAQAYRAEGDKRLRNETDAKRIESDTKIQLLRKAKKRYETLAMFGGAVEDDEGETMPQRVQVGDADSQTCNLTASAKRRCANPSPENSSSRFDRLGTSYIDPCLASRPRCTTRLLSPSRSRERLRRCPTPRARTNGTRRSTSQSSGPTRWKSRYTIRCLLVTLLPSVCFGFESAT